MTFGCSTKLSDNCKVGPYNRHKWGYNPYKWHYKWVTGVITPRIVLTPFTIGSGPTLCGGWDIDHLGNMSAFDL